MKTKILIILLFISGTINTFCQEKILINGDGLVNLSIDSVLSLYDLHNPGQDFEKLHHLGKIIDSSFTKNFVYEQYNLMYNGIELIYINKNGSIELMEFRIVGSKPVIKLHDWKFKKGKIPVELLRSKNKRFLDLYVNFNSHKKGTEKFHGFNYLELYLNEDQTVNKIIYKNKMD